MPKSWVFITTSKVNSSEVSMEINQFLSEWKTHGKLISSFDLQIYFDQVILITDLNDESSGCSIDNLQRSIQEIVNQNGGEITEFGSISYLDNESENEKITSIPRSKIKEYLLQGKINKKTVIVNQEILNSADPKSELFIDAEKSWLSKAYSFTN